MRINLNLNRGLLLFVCNWCTYAGADLTEQVV